MICSKCQSPIEDGKVYCSACGAEVVMVKDYDFEEEFLLDILSDEDEKSKTNPDGESSESQANPETLKAIKILKFISLIFVFFVVFGLFVYIYFNSYGYYLNAGKRALKALDYVEAQYNFKTCIEKNDNRPEGYKYLTFTYGEMFDQAAIDELKRTAKTMDILQVINNSVIPTPNFNYEGGRYTDDLRISLSAPIGYRVLYTIGGGNPKETGIMYNGRINLILGSTQIRAVCVNEDGDFGPIISNVYEIEYESPVVPEVTPDTGEFDRPTNISVRAPKNCQVFYSWDVNEDISNYTRVTGKISVPEGNNVLCVYAKDNHGLCSDVLQCNYKYFNKN